MTIDMNLRRKPFESIAAGKKTVELRLNDEKRRGIKAGDYIRFTSPEGLKLTVEVTDVRRFRNFEELYACYPPEKLGYGDGESCSPDDMLVYYGKEEIKKYGVAAIEMRL